MEPVQSTEAVIEAQNLTKSFGPKPVLRDFHFKAGPGELHFLAGPNGSGKTTLLRIFSTLLRADGGTLSVAGGHLPQEPGKVRQNISAYFFSNRGLWPQLTVEENLKAHTRLFGMAGNELPSHGLRLIEGLKDKKPFELSLGQRQMTLIARALCRPTSLVFLDEPFAVLDKVNSQKLLDVLQELTERSTTIIATTQSQALKDLPKDFKVTEIGGRS